MQMQRLRNKCPTFLIFQNILPYNKNFYESSTVTIKGKGESKYVMVWWCGGLVGRWFGGAVVRWFGGVDWAHLLLLPFPWLRHVDVSVQYSMIQRRSHTLSSFLKYEWYFYQRLNSSFDL